MINSGKCETSKRVVLKGYSAKRGHWLLYQPTCKMWGCKPCSEVKKAQWAIRVNDGVGEYRLKSIMGWKFVTMTSHSKNKTMEQCLYVWPKAWAKLSARMRRRYPGIRYCMIPELHKDFRVHAHIIASGGIVHKWLKNNSAETGFGWKCDVKPLKNRAAYYVVKYLTKAISFPDWPKGFRRIRTSQKWPALDDALDFEGEAINWEYYCTYEAQHLYGLAAMMAYDIDSRVEVLE